MEHEKVLEYQENLIRNYKYRPLPTMFSDDARAFYKENIPDCFCLEGSNMGLYGPSGMKISNRYNRIVIGDYGAYVEIMPEDMVHENIVVKKGQEYRDTNARYSENVKYSWLTLRDESDVKIYFQKKSVAYADYVPGRYYVSVYECMPIKVNEKLRVSCVSREEITDWLKAYGVFTPELVDYYSCKADSYSDVINFAITNNVSPFDFELWMSIADVCQEMNPLTFEQFQAISYNLSVIHCQSCELNGKLESLSVDVKTAIEMGYEGLEFPYEIQSLPAESIRVLLRLPAEDLLCVCRFSKIVAGQKVEEQSHDVEGLIKAASERVQVNAVSQAAPELVN